MLAAAAKYSRQDLLLRFRMRLLSAILSITAFWSTANAVIQVDPVSQNFVDEDGRVA